MTPPAESEGTGGRIEALGQGRRFDEIITEKRIMFAGQIKVLLKLAIIYEKECKPAKSLDSPPQQCSAAPCVDLEKAEQLD